MYNNWLKSSVLSVALFQQITQASVCKKHLPTSTRASLTALLCVECVFWRNGSYLPWRPLCYAKLCAPSPLGCQTWHWVWGSLCRGRHLKCLSLLTCLGLSSNLGCSVGPEGSCLSPKQCQEVWQVSVTPGMHLPGDCVHAHHLVITQVITTILLLMDIIRARNTHLSRVWKVCFFSFGRGRKKKSNSSLKNITRHLYLMLLNIDFTKSGETNVSSCNEVTRITCMDIPVHWVFCWAQE